MVGRVEQSSNAAIMSPLSPNKTYTHLLLSLRRNKPTTWTFRDERKFMNQFFSIQYTCMYKVLLLNLT